MKNWRENIIRTSSTVRDALGILDKCAIHGNVLFVLDSEDRMVGTLTDGDIRRGLLKGANIDSLAGDVMYRDFSYLEGNEPRTVILNEFRKLRIAIVPVLDAERRIDTLLDITELHAALPLTAIIMAGGKGERLMPLTKDVPKPMLKVGDKPIIELNIDRFANFGIDKIRISVNYLGQVIMDHFGDGSDRNLDITYIREEVPMGTIGSVSLAAPIHTDNVLIMNSDLLTNIDFSDFYSDFLENNADMAIAATTYQVDIPYAVLEVNGSNQVNSLTEKPRYTYFSNAGIYIVKKDLLSLIPRNEYYNVTDLIEEVIRQGKKVITYPIRGYWLDIGKMNDYQKANEDIKHIKFE